MKIIVSHGNAERERLRKGYYLCVIIIINTTVEISVMFNLFLLPSTKKLHFKNT